MISVTGIIAIALAIGAALGVIRALMKCGGWSGGFSLALVAVLAVLWLGAARQNSRSTQSQQAWESQQRAMAEHHAAVARNIARQQAQVTQQLAESQNQMAMHQAKLAANKFAMKVDSDLNVKQRVIGNAPLNVPLPNRPFSAPAAPAAPVSVAPVVPAAPVAMIGGEPAMWLMVAPLGIIAVALIGFLASRLARRPGAGNGIGWVVAGIAILVLVGFFFVGSTNRTSTVIVPMEQIVEPLPAGTELPGGWTHRRPPQAWSHGEPPAAAVVDVDAAGRESIDAIWDKLSGPQIKLDVDEHNTAIKEALQTVELSPKQITVAQAKLNDAAKVLELAAEGMTESNSQGWLVVMAEALLKATAKTSAPAPAPPKPVATAFAAASAQTGEPPKLAAPPKEFPRTKLGRRTPDWVVHPPGIVGEVRKYVVHAGPYQSLEECHRELEDRMRSIVQARVVELASASSRTASVPTLQAMGIGTDYILRELCTEEFVESTEFDFGDMLTAHALMEFNAAQDAALMDRWTAHARRAGVERVVYGAGLVVGCLALVFGLLKVDTWTRGYYTKRLFLGVPAAIIAVVALITLA